MPALPAPVIHLFGALRPRLLRPDLRAASIAQIDFPGLKKAGFNAVVVDKDNCVTVPHADSIHPPYAQAWRALLDTFPGRVLVVSNSAGSAKDRGGIGAESLAMTLRAPVLAHRHAKPACAKDILAFFHGKTAPRTHRAQVVARLEAAERAEDSAEQILLDKWRGEVEDGPLCGALTDARTLEEKMVAAQMRKPAVSPRAPASDAPPPPPPATTAPVPPEPLRIVVVGDRLFTDTLQARELDRHLPASPVPATLSIQTTDLPQPNDVRFLRWLEDWLSGYKLAHGGRTGGVAWDTYLIPLPPVPPVPRWMDLQRAKLAPYNPITRIDAALDDGGPPITWDPRTWRPKPVARAVLRSAAEAAAYLSRLTWEGAKIAAVALWTKARAWSSHKYAQIKAERARRAEERERNEIDKEREEEKAAASAAVPEAVGPHGVAAKTKA